MGVVGHVAWVVGVARERVLVDFWISCIVIRDAGVKWLLAVHRWHNNSRMYIKSVSFNAVVLQRVKASVKAKPTGKKARTNSKIT